MLAPKHIDQALDMVRSNAAVIEIRTMTKATRISPRTLKSFERDGLRVLWADADGKGFRLASGKSSVYVYPDNVFVFGL